MADQYNCIKKVLHNRVHIQRYAELSILSSFKSPTFDYLKFVSVILGNKEPYPHIPRHHTPPRARFISKMDLEIDRVMEHAGTSAFTIFLMDDLAPRVAEKFCMLRFCSNRGSRTGRALKKPLGRIDA